MLSTGPGTTVSAQCYLDTQEEGDGEPASFRWPWDRNRSRKRAGNGKHTYMEAVDLQLITNWPGKVEEPK